MDIAKALLVPFFRLSRAFLRSSLETLPSHLKPAMEPADCFDANSEGELFLTFEKDQQRHSPARAEKRLGQLLALSTVIALLLGATYVHLAVRA